MTNEQCMTAKAETKFKTLTPYGERWRYGWHTGVPGILLDQRTPEVKNKHQAILVLTHESTGKKFPHHFSTKKTALYVARELGRLADWSLPIDEIKKKYPWGRVKELAGMLCTLNRGL